MSLIPNPHHKPVVVIGDLVLTDGIFARLTGSHFVYVQHLRHKSDTWLVKLMYLVDDAAASIARMLHWVQRVWQKRNIRA